MTTLLAAISGLLIVPALVQNNAFPFSLSILPIAGIVLACVALENSGLFMAGILARRFPFMRNLARYGATGVFNTLFDLTVLTTLAFLFQIYQGPLLALFNIISFTSTTAVSYFINRHWSFAADGNANAREFAGFMLVGATSLIINTILVYVLTTHIPAPKALSPAQWVSVAKLFGIITSFLWNFSFFHFVIFRKRPVPSISSPQQQ